MLPPRWITAVGSGTAGACSNSRSPPDYEFATDRPPRSSPCRTPARADRPNPGAGVMRANELGPSRPSGFRTGTLSVAAPAGLGMSKPGVLAAWSASASDPKRTHVRCPRRRGIPVTSHPVVGSRSLPGRTSSPTARSASGWAAYVRRDAGTSTHPYLRATSRAPCCGGRRSRLPEPTMPCSRASNSRKPDLVVSLDYLLFSLSWLTQHVPQTSTAANA